MDTDICMAGKKIKTIFLDIDGTILKHTGTLTSISLAAQNIYGDPLLEGVLEKFNEWENKGYKIILVTGRKECLREITEEQLVEAGLFWDQIIFGVGAGPRVLINDLKPDGTETAFAINIERNKGLKDLYV